MTLAFSSYKFHLEFENGPQVSIDVLGGYVKKKTYILGFFFFNVIELFYYFI
jgi:hypothetical protein